MFTVNGAAQQAGLRSARAGMYKCIDVNLYIDIYKTTHMHCFRYLLKLYSFKVRTPHRFTMFRRMSTYVWLWLCHASHVSHGGGLPPTMNVTDHHKQNTNTDAQQTQESLFVIVHDLRAPPANAGCVTSSAV